MSEKKYTAEDFAKAQAATLNRTRGLGGRVGPGDSFPWLILSEDDRRWVRDEDMAAGGWVPVPSSPAKPTITESRFGELTAEVWGTEPLRDLLEELGIEVVPDSELTNPEHDRDWWVENANTGDIEDCDACVESGDLCPVHFGMGEGAEFVARKLRALGADPELFNSLPDPVTAPGGDGDE